MMVVRLKTYWSLVRSALVGDTKDFTSGEIGKAAFLIAFPAMLEFSLEALFVLVDLLYVSSLGDGAITLVGVTNSVLILTQSIAVGLGIAVTAMVSRRVGSRKPRSAGLAGVQAINLGLIGGILTILVITFFASNILRFVGCPEEHLQVGMPYVRLMFIGAILVIIRILMNGILRGVGNTPMAMRVLLLANLINAVLSGVLIFGIGPFPRLGLIGAAWGTVLGNLAAVVYQSYYLGNVESRIEIGRKQWKWFPPMISMIIRLAFAGMVQFIVPALSRFLMISVVALLGAQTLTGYIIANRLILFTVLPAWGIATAAGVLTGQNLGAGKPERAVSSVWKTGVFNCCFLGSIALVIWRFSASMASWFSSDAEVVSSASHYLNYMALAYFFFGFTMVISRSLNAAGAVKTVTLLNVMMFFGIQLPLAYLLAIYAGWGEQGIFISILLSEMIMALVCVGVFRKGKWKSINV